MGRILITGATGNVGRYVAKYAIENKDEITVAGRNTSKLESMFPSGDVQKVAFDFSKPETFEKALVDVDRVFLMRPPYMGDYKDLMLFLNALTQQDDLKMVSFLSLIGIEHNPMPPHYKIEKAIKRLNLPYSFIRPSFYMQNISGVHALEIRGFDRIIVPVNHALTSFIDTEDIGELTTKVLNQPEKYHNQAFSITGPEALYFTVAKILSQALNRKITYADPNPKLTKDYWINIRGLDKTYADIMGMLYLMTRMGSAKKTTDTFANVMGKQPTSFAEFVNKNLSAWKK